MALSCDYLLAVLFVIQEVGSTAPMDSGLILDEKKGRATHNETIMMIELAMLSTARIGSARLHLYGRTYSLYSASSCSIVFDSPLSASAFLCLLCISCFLGH